MEFSEDNLLVRLHKWAYRQDENFLTEAFAHLLTYLLAHEPEAAVGLLNDITGGFFSEEGKPARGIKVRTQVTTSEGKPDLEVRSTTPSRMVFIEVKSESPVKLDQLRRYQAALQANACPSRLVLLTRHPTNLGENDPHPDKVVRWHQVAAWLEDHHGQYNFKPVSSHLVGQFLGFLTERNMTMSQVSWELPSGVRALRRLADMLYEAASACGVEAQIWGNALYCGVYLNRRDYWLGISFDEPEILVFHTYNRKVDPEAAARLEEGEVLPWKEDPTTFYWLNRLDLQSEEVHFFARSKVSQVTVLEEFLNRCLRCARQVELPRGSTAAVDAAADDE